MWPRRFARLFKIAVNEFLTDNCPQLAAAISYYVLFSLFPLTLALVSVLGFVLRSLMVQDEALEAIGDLLPVSGDFIARTIQGVVAARGAVGIVAIIGLMWAGMALFTTLQKSVNTAWGTRESRPFFRARLVEIGMMMSMGLLLLLAIGLTTGLKAIRELSLPVLRGQFLDGDMLWNYLTTIVPPALTFVGFVYLYKFVPNTRVRWRAVWVGALLAAVSFEITKQVFFWFVGGFINYNLVYGSVGAVIALLTWIYISAVILLFFAKLTSIYPRVMSSPEVVPEQEQDDRRAQRHQILSPVALFLSLAMKATSGLNAIKRLILKRS